MDVDLDLVLVDEFDALSVEVRRPRQLHRTSLVSEPKEKYPAKLHARKVADALGAQDGIVYLPGEPSRTYEDSDMGPVFRQRRYFYYVTGANFEDAAATYDLADDKLILWIPSAGSARDVLYSGRPPTRAECEAITDVDQVRNIGELDDYLRESLFGRFPPGGTLYILDPAHVPGAVNTIHLHPRFARRDRLASPDLLYGAGFDPSAMQPKVDSTSLRPAMDRARVRKTPYEVAQIRRANAVSGDAHRAVLERLARMASERDVEAVFLATSIRAGARSQAYAPIAGSGENASMLHYSANADPLADRTLLVLDAGAEWACYASDVTRTLPLAPAGFPPAAQRVYDAVARMQAAALALVRPGRRFLALQAAATVVAADALRTLGLLRGPLPDILRTGVVAAFFPHGLGHHVGLEVHDVLSRELLGYAAETHDPPVAGTPRRRAAAPRGKRQLVDPSWCAEVVRIGAAGVADGGPVVRDVLEADMVVTIEPGIYFNRDYIREVFLKDERFANLIDEEVLEEYYSVGGVRIEDDILVTENGYENLTTAPTAEEALRIIRRGCE